MTARIKASRVALSKLLSENSFRVPYHQRRYDWQASNVTDLLGDLCDAYRTNAAEYFLGTVMLIPTGRSRPKFLINDGQQRLITFAMIAGRLAQLLPGQKSYRGGHSTHISKVVLGPDRLEQDLLAAHDRFPDLQLGIEVSADDTTSYKSLLAGHALNTGSSNIVAAWKEISLFFSHADRSSKEFINSFAQYILKKVSVVRLTVPDSLDLHAIFETINGRGKPLSELDMIKNFLLSKVSSKAGLLAGVQKDFDAIYGNFSYSGRITDYLRCQMQVRIDFLPETHLYRAVKAEYQDETAEKVRWLLSALGNSNEMGLYRFIVKPLRHEDEINEIAQLAGLEDGNRSLIDYMLELSMYSVVHPVLMSLLLRFTSKRMKRISAQFLFEACRSLASFVMRVVHTRGAFQPSLYERELASLAKRIYKGKCGTLEKFNAALLKLDTKGSVTNVCNDPVFQRILSEISVKHIRKAKQLLVAVENFEHRRDIRIADGLRVDHILPPAGQSHPSWGATNDIQRQLYSHRLGNMCLLEEGLASSDLRTATFDRKRETYSRSSIPGTQALSALEHWDSAAIVERQEGLARSASAIWKFS